MSTQTFTESTKRAKETFEENATFFTNTTNLLMDTFNKQMNSGYEFYNQMTETIQMNDMANLETIFKDNAEIYQKVIKRNFELSKEIVDQFFSPFVEKDWSPISSKNTKAILSIFNKQIDQSQTFANDFLLNLQKQDILSNDEFKKYSTRYNELMQESIKDSEKAINEMIKAYKKSAPYSEKSAKDLIADIQQQTELFIKTQTKFSEELMSTLLGKKNKTEHKIIV